jgi:hypothetical protein
VGQLDQSKTLQDLENSDLGDPDTGETPLIRKCLALYRKPLGAFTIENLRLAIGQQMGLRYLIPMAMIHLRQDPLSQGDFYPGDLLWSVLRVPEEEWLESDEMLALRAELRLIAKGFLDKTSDMSPEQKDIFQDLIQAAENVSNLN